MATPGAPCSGSAEMTSGGGAGASGAARALAPPRHTSRGAIVGGRSSLIIWPACAFRLGKYRSCQGRNRYTRAVLRVSGTMRFVIASVALHAAGAALAIATASAPAKTRHPVIFEIVHASPPPPSQAVASAPASLPP